MSLSYRTRRRRVLTAIILGALAGFLAIFGTGPYGWINMIKVQKRQQQLRREILINMARNELLRREIKRMRSDNFYIETKARERYGMVRPGETSYRFYPADSLKSESETPFPKTP